MNTKTNSPRLNITGTVDWLSDREILSGLLKHWRRRLGYCSIFAAVPAILASNVQEARSDETRKPERSVAGRGANLLRMLNLKSSPELLRRQSAFLLPHQRAGSTMLAVPAGSDDCPGRSIPGGSYPFASPYQESGDTTGANDTVSRVQFYYYYNFDALGPDVAYSFTLTGRGPNPVIEVSTTSSSYKPLIYILPGGYAGACPSGLGNYQYVYVLANSNGAGTATLDRGNMTGLPLNVPLHLFIDSLLNNGTDSGPYTLKMYDVTIAPPACPNNPIDCPEFFIYRNYVDFLSREPDPPGFAGWLAVLNNCAAGDPSCDRIHVSGAFFQSPEFQARGYFVYRQYSVAFGRKPSFAEFIDDMSRVSGFLSTVDLETAKTNLVDVFMSRPAFVNAYNSLGNTAYVNTLVSTAGVTLSNQQALIDALNAGTKSRLQVLREIMESTAVYQKYYNQAFVVTQYFGYLRRDPDALYLDWIRVLETTGDPRHMINGFLNSIEYRARFRS